ncbi:uncharacterized protein, partial [Leptinotarsa decemlineata]|uniref:uncharacterized protein n=1 Tax=Leptinotarsa decemlineata TaxID=7539 RepID=UPI003D3089AA
CYFLLGFHVHFQDYKLPHVFEFERKILLYLGCFPNNETCRGSLSNLTAVITLSISISIYMMMIIGIFIEYKNVSAVAETLLIAGTQTACLCKVFNLIIKKKNILELEDIISKPEFRQFSEENLKIMKNSVRIAEWFGRIYRMICFTAITSDMFHPLSNIEDGALPLTVWNPWDVRKTSHYISAFTFHMVSLSLSALTNSTIDIFTCQYIMIIVGQLKIIKNGLSDIDYGSSNDNVMRDIIRNVNSHTTVLRLVKYHELVSEGSQLFFFSKILFSFS